MSEFEPEIQPETTEEPPRRRPLWAKVLIGTGVAIVGLVLVGVALYNFGGMARSVNDPQIKQQFDQMVRAGQAQPIERRFVIPIPGCNCHSDDPVLTEQHRGRRMRECSGCHSR